MNLNGEIYLTLEVNLNLLVKLTSHRRRTCWRQDVATAGSCTRQPPGTAATQDTKQEAVGECQL